MDAVKDNLSLVSLQSQTAQVERELRASSAAPAERQQLLELLSRATSVVSDIKARINATAPVSILPPEPLTRIFFILRDIQPPLCAGPGACGSMKLGWITVTHVCSSWRRTAIRCPALWAEDIFLLKRQWAKCMLLRSQQVPLKIIYRPTRPTWPVMHDVELIAEHLAHIHTLVISPGAGKDVSSPLFWGKLVAPAPVLHTLDYFGTITYEDPSQAFSVPIDFLGNNAPCLRILHLYGALIPWSSPILRNLQRLRIVLNHSGQRPVHWIPTLSQFLDALERMPDLTYLEVAGVLPSSSHMHGVFSPGERRVELPHIQSIDFGGDTLDVALALSCLITPLDAHLILSCTPLSDLGDIASLFRLVSGRFGTVAPILIECLEVKAFPDAFDIVAVMKFQNGSSSRTEVIFQPSPWNVEILQQFLMAMLHCQIFEFTITGMPLQPMQWHHLFTYKNMACMESAIIAVPPETLPGFVAFLTPRTVSGLQKLRNLNFDRTNFEGMQRWLDFLKDILKKRKECGMVLEEIAFHRCSSLSDEWVVQLQDIVPSVIISDESPSGDGSTDEDSDRPSYDEFCEYSGDELSESSGSG